MFSDLFEIICLVKDSIKDLSILNKDNERESAILEMLKTYFIMLDSYGDGMKMIESISENPTEYIKGLDENSLEAQINIWDKFLRKQSARLYQAQQYISSQSYLAVINPTAQKRIEDVIGYKMDSIVSLHGLGSVLFFRSMLPQDETPEAIASLVSQVLTQQDNVIINKDKVRKELQQLKEGLDEFRAIIEGATRKEELLALSNKAREEINTIY